MSERKAIFITGGGSGIGRATALYFAKRGWFVGIGDIDALGMEVTLDQIGNGFSYMVDLDVRDRAAWDRALDTFSTATGGRIDVMFNNAGIGIDGPIVDNTVEEIERCLDINLKGVIFGAQAAFPHLRKTAPGSALINTASAAAIWGVPNLSVYSATKFGVRSITEALDIEWAESGIRVASLMPGFIDTPILDSVTSDQSNMSGKQQLLEAGMEVNPVEVVPEVVWNAVHGNDVHYTVGKMAKRVRRAARWFPNRVRKEMKAAGASMGN
ncbi:SDR family oxidoreductase [Qipengyuania oceanensis]|uniref:SDR family oxidoreductase n=1 Tax=Qipengyuania oceanensis TaxID=1463597 RepID=A0A844YE03_9SPHN|nr:SDR family oxidoreductase [Qipengyuania oceanensis]MXO62391.1 SDR family oxidoreductase [Qipengyuania oceanensis]